VTLLYIEGVICHVEFAGKTGCVHVGQNQKVVGPVVEVLVVHFLSENRDKRTVSINRNDGFVVILKERTKSCIFTFSLTSTLSLKACSVLFDPNPQPNFIERWE
jgi:hypothetical protein